MNRTFWRATAERALRGAVAAVFAAYVAGDVVFDVTHIHTLNQILALAAGGAFSAAALSVIGNGVSKNGPSFTSAEVVPDSQVVDQRGDVGSPLLFILAAVGLIVIVLLLVGHR